MVPPRVADFFKMIRNSPLSEWLITPSCKEGHPKEMPSTKDRTDKQKAPWPLPCVPAAQLTESCQERSQEASASYLRRRCMAAVKKAREVLPNSRLQEGRNFPLACHGHLAVSDLFA